MWTVSGHRLTTAKANDGKVDTLLKIFVADNIAAAADGVERIDVRVLLSDPEAEALSQSQRLEPVTVASIGHDSDLRNVRPAKGIEQQIELRLNNILLEQPAVRDGWLVFPAKTGQFALKLNPYRRVEGPG